MADDLTDFIPEGAVILNVLRVVEYLDEDGHLCQIDLSYGSDGEDIPTGKSLELIEWARHFAVYPMIVGMLHDYILDEGGDDDEISDVTA